LSSVFPDHSVQDNLRVGGISRPQGELAVRIDQIYAYFPRRASAPNSGPAAFRVASSKCWRSVAP